MSTSWRLPPGGPLDPLLGRTAKAPAKLPVTAKLPPFVPTFEQCHRYFEERLPGQRIGSRREVSVKCPFHDDGKASMSINLEQGTWFCHACSIGGGLLDFERKLTGKDAAECWGAINATIGRDALKASSSKSGRIVATYDYRDAAGKVIYQAVRSEPKGFSQRRSDGKGGWVWKMNGVTRVPFNLPALVRSNVALIAEGEKDAQNLQKAAAEFPNENGTLSYAATTNIGGAGKWLDSYSPYLAGKKVFIFQDDDEAGREHAQQVCASVSKYAQAVHRVELPGLAEHGDVSDYLETHTPAQLFELIKAAPVWTAPVAAAQPTMTAEGASGYTLVPLSELMTRPDARVSYLLEGRLVAGTVSAVVAKPKVGKSTLGRNLAFSVATGRPFLGCTVAQGEVIYLALEERPEEIKADFQAMGATGNEPIQIHAAQAPVAAMLELVRIVREHKPRLVVIDPLFRLARIRDEKAYAETYQALGPLIDIARETGTHILLTHHAGKSLKADAIDAPLGSTALGGLVSTLLVLKRTEGYRTIQSVQRIGVDLPEAVLSFDRTSCTLTLGTSRAGMELADAEERILEHLDGISEPQTQEQIRDKVEGKTRTIRAALTSLTQAGKVQRKGEGKRGNPYSYERWFSGSTYMSGTREPETENCPQPRVNTEAKVVPENSEKAFLVPENLQGENCGPGEAENVAETANSPPEEGAGAEDKGGYMEVEV